MDAARLIALFLLTQSPAVAAGGETAGELRDELRSEMPNLRATSSQAFLSVQRLVDEGAPSDRVAAEADRVLARSSERLGPRDPSWPGLAVEHAHIMMWLGRADRAAEDLKRIDAVKPPTYESLLASSELHAYVDGRGDLALQAAAAAERLRPDAPEALVAEAKALAPTRPSEALAFLQKALRLRPADYDNLLLLAKLYRALGRFKDARAVFREAREKAPREAAAYVLLGYAERLAGESDDSLASFRKAAELAPGDPVILHHLAFALLEKGSTSEGCALLEKARSIFEATGRKGDSDWTHTMEMRLDSCEPDDRWGRTEIDSARELRRHQVPCSASWLRSLRQLDGALCATGSVAEADEESTRALSLCRDAPGPLRVALLIARAEVLLAKGDVASSSATARAALDGLIAHPADTRRRCVYRGSLALSLAGLFERLRAPAEMDRAYALVEETLRCPGSPGFRAEAEAALMRHAISSSDRDAVIRYRDLASADFTALGASEKAGETRREADQAIASMGEAKPPPASAPERGTASAADDGRDPFARATRAEQENRLTAAADLADDALVRVLGLSPADADAARAIVRHSRFAREAGRTEALKHDLERLERLHPSYERSVGRAEVLLDLGQARPALAAAEEAARARPSDAAAPAAAARALAALGQPLAGAERMRRAVELDPSHERRLSLAELYRLAGRFDLARQAYRQAESAAPREAEEYVERGYSRMYLGDEPGALADLRAAERLHPEDPSIVHHLGWMLWQSGRHEEGCAYLKKALDLLKAARRTSEFTWIHTGLFMTSHCPDPHAVEDKASLARQGLRFFDRCSEGWADHVGSGIASMVQGQNLRAASQALADARKECPHPSFRVKAGLLGLQTVVSEGLGRRGAARAQAAELLGLLRARPPADVEECGTTLHLATEAGAVLERLGDVRDARDAFELAEERAECFRTLRQKAEFHAQFMRHAARWKDWTLAARERDRASDAYDLDSDSASARRVVAEWKDLAEGGEGAPASSGQAAPAPAAPPGPQPAFQNLVLVSVDALRVDRVTARRAGRLLMPRLGGLDGTCVSFEQAIAQAPWTLPSMMSVWTSLYPHRHGVTNRFANLSARAEDLTRLPRGIRTFPEALHDAGFETAAYTGDGGLDRAPGFSRGFDLYFDSAPFAGFSTTVPLAVDWLRTRGGRRFFLFLHGYDVHGQGPEPPDDWIASSGTSTGRERFMQLRRRSIEGQPLGLGPAERAAWIDLYDARARSADGWLDRFWRDAHAIPSVATSTLFVFIADHGESLLERGRLDHGMGLEDEELRVPFILCGSGLPARRIGEQARLIDVAPTLLDLLGVSDGRFQTQGQGVSLAAAARGAAMPALDALSETDFLFRVARRSLRTTDGWKLVFDLEDLGWELYDLRRDPGERTNLASRDAKTRARLERELRALMDVPPDPAR